jgi:hypothetical protein
MNENENKKILKAGDVVTYYDENDLLTTSKILKVEETDLEVIYILVNQDQIYYDQVL